MVLHYLRLLPIYIRDEIVNLNLFESYDPRTPTNIFREQVLTRCFILMLMISFAATGFYVFLVNENQEVTIEKPSLATYLQLYDNHADTLQCPCSRLSVPYRNFLNVTNVFHEVCSSSLVSSIWLNYLSSFDPIVVPSWGESNYVRDFRTIGNSYFQLLAIFCSLAENSVDNAHLAFMNTPFINNYVLAPELFNQQTQTIIESYINNTRNEFTLTMNYIKMSFTTSYFLTGVNTNANITVTNNNQLIVKDFKYRTALITPQGISFIDTCYCATFSFYCTIHTFIYIDHDRPDYEQDLSELPTGCIPLTGFLMSKISWWFNTTSLKDIQTTYSMVIDSQPSPNIQPLNTSMTKKRKNLYLSTLISDMFIESWTTNGTYYNRFYDSCSPASCSYTIIQRRNIVITLLVFISVCSGIMRTLQIFLPFLFQLVFFFINWWKNRVNHQPLLSISARFKHFLRILWESFINMNSYKHIPTNELSIQQQRLHTKVCLVLFTSSLTILLFYTAMKEKSITKTYAKPSIVDYEHLLELYSNDINCPCTRISIPYKEFVTELRVEVLHQVCSTSVVSIILKGVYLPYSNYNSGAKNDKDFRNHRDVFTETLRQLCTFAQSIINNNIMIFHTSTIFVKQVMSRSQFYLEMDRILNRFKKQVPLQFAQTLQLIRINIQGNALMATLSNNWKLVLADKGKGRNASFRSEPIIYVNTQQNTSCSCATSRSCTMPAQMFDSNDVPYYTFEGLFIGCYSLETAMRSSLSCFYSMKCVNDTYRILNYYLDELEIFYNRTGKRAQFNASLTRFSINDTVETIAKEMFIESWASNTSYERFFNSCAPSACTYKYYYRFDALDVLTTLLSVYAGLSLVTRFIVLYLFKIIKIIQTKIQNRSRVMPLQ